MLRNILPATILAVALGACAGTPERPTAEITRAQTLIEQAEEQGAQRLAGADLERAREKLRRAQSAVDDGEMNEAQRLAAEAALDAEFAVAKAGSGEARQAAQELDRSLETLREEAARGQTPPTQ